MRLPVLALASMGRFQYTFGFWYWWNPARVLECHEWDPE